MNRAEFITNIATKTGLNKADSGNALDAVIETIIDTVAAGDVVKLIGFGSFEPKARAARTARNPKDGTTVEVAAKTIPVFKAGKEFKDAVKV